VLKVRGGRLVFTSGVWLMVYVLCVFFVASFIVFEVLDVDGSEIPKYPTKIDVRLADPPHDDLKRAWLQGPIKVWMGPRVVEPLQPVRPDPGMTAASAPTQPVREVRVTLPRAALSEPPPPAA
jgi:hypothetical protein